MSLFQTLAQLEQQGKVAAICTIVATQGSTPRHVGSKMLVFPDGRIEGTIGGGELESRVIKVALEVIATGFPQNLEYAMADPKRGDPGVCGGTVGVFVEPVGVTATLVVAGAGHVGKAVAELAHWLGYRVVVTDDRPGFCTPETIPDADEYLPIPLRDLPDKINITQNTFLVLATRNVNVDVEGLPALLDTQAGYIGVIGSRRRWETTRKKLVATGIAEEQLGRISSPIGLELNAETPEEIALSILAEITMLRRGGDGSRMAHG